MALTILTIDDAEIKNAKDLTVSLEKAEVSASARDNNRWRATVGDVRARRAAFEKCIQGKWTIGGASLAVPSLRRADGWGLILLLVAVFPANVDMLMNSGQFPSKPVWTMVARLPLQGVLIAWVWWAASERTTIVQPG